MQKVPPNKQAVEGAGVYIHNGALIMNDGIIRNNSIYVDDASASKPEHAYGGGVSVNAGSFTMNGGGIEDNGIEATQAVYGGGIYSAVNITINGGYITGNTVTGPSAYGAGICVIGDITMNWAQTAYNTAGTGTGTALGGGVYSEGAFTFIDGIINGNNLTPASGSAGGGIYVKGAGSITMSGGSVLGNSVTGGGGGIFFNGSGIFKMRGGVIGGNTAAQGGGVWLSGGMGGFQKDFYGASDTCGIIYGAEAAGVDNVFGYELRNSGSGAAIYYGSKIRNTTVDESTPLSHDDNENWTD
jgi:hypothetical protein